MKKKLLIVGGIIALGFAVMFISMLDGLSEMTNAPLNGIDLSNIPDGSYTGVHDFKRWKNTLVVHVKDNRITGIDIVRDISGAKLTGSSGKVFPYVIEAQNTTIDTFAGSTVTSKAYLKAIENALTLR